MNAFLILAACKAMFWALAFLLMVRMLPARVQHLRRLMSLVGVWGLLVVPWVTAGDSIPKMQIPEIHSAGAVTSALSATWQAIWLIGALIAFARLAGEFLLWQKRIARAVLHNAGSPNLYLSDEVSGPCLVGAFQANILMPYSALDWPAAQWHCAVRHELQHARQHDGLHRLVAGLLRAIWWWNPMVQRLCSRLELESEVVCDRAAVDPGGACAYGRMLLEFAMEPAGGAVAWASKHSLRERLERLMEGGSEEGISFLPIIIAAISLVSVLLATISIQTSSSTLILDQEAELRLSADPFPGK